MDEAESATRDRLVMQLETLGVRRGDVLLVHTSFRAVGRVDGGPAGLIQALTDAVGPRGTLVMPSWPDDGPFLPTVTDASATLGIVARTFWRLPGVQRSGHVQAFAARGPEATYVLQDPLPLPPHIPLSPVGRVRELDGQVLLLGVDHDANTTIHLAELIADVPYRVTRSCTIMRDGELVRVEYEENDHCCSNFVLANDWLREAGSQAEGTIGSARAKLIRSRAIVDAVVSRLVDEPLLFLHPPSAGCEECDEARSSLTRVRRSSGSTS